jgi:hypothetical protein
MTPADPPDDRDADSAGAAGRGSPQGRPPQALPAGGRAEGGRAQLAPAAQRALAEAQARRAEIDRKAKSLPKEHPAREGPEPTRYGDWEVNGIASDF